MRFPYQPPPEVAAKDARYGVEASYYITIHTNNRTVEWSQYRHLPEGMHWKKGDEMGLGSDHHEKTQSYSSFLQEPFRPLQEELNFVFEYLKKQVGPEDGGGHLRPLRYDGFPHGGDKICYKRETNASGEEVTFYIEPLVFDGEVRWSFFPHLPEGMSAKKGDETGMGSMHSDGRQTFKEFRQKPKYDLPAEVYAMMLEKIKDWPSKEDH